MIKLDDNLLNELGLGALPKEEKTAFLRHMYETLEMRVGSRLAERMTNAQMAEFEQFINSNDEQGAFRWLEANFPNYKDVVAEEFSKLKEEVRPLAQQIVAASQAQAAQNQSLGQVPPPATQQPSGYDVSPVATPPAPAPPSNTYQPHVPPAPAPNQQGVAYGGYGNHNGHQQPHQPAHQQPGHHQSTHHAASHGQPPAASGQQPHHQQVHHQPHQPVHGHGYHPSHSAAQQPAPPTPPAFAPTPTPAPDPAQSQYPQPVPPQPYTPASTPPPVSDNTAAMPQQPVPPAQSSDDNQSQPPQAA